MAIAVNDVPTVAILHSQDLIEEWLDDLELSLEDLQRELVGSWMFTYAQALSRAGVGTVFVFVTRRVSRCERAIHQPTGAVMWLVPPPRTYSALRTALESTGLRDRRFAGAIMRHLAPYLATPLRSLARVLRAEHCGAILCQEYECPRFDVAVLLGRLMDVPVFPSYHAGDNRSRLERLIHPVTIRACAGVIISAEAEARRAQRVYGIPETKLARIPNPIDLDVWRPQDRAQARAALDIPQDALVAVWHGALYVKTKGLDLIVEAWERVTRERPGRDLRLMLVGGGAEAGELRRLITALGAPGVSLVDRWMHDRTRLRLHLCAADLYVFASRHGDGRELALTEAMACGLPVVATELPGAADTVGLGDAAGGVLVPVGDPKSLADAIGTLLDDDAKRRELAERARLRIDARVSLEAVGVQMRDFFIAHGMRGSGG